MLLLYLNFFPLQFLLSLEGIRLGQVAVVLVLLVWVVVAVL